MPKLRWPPPFSPIEPVTEVLHGVPITDPYPMARRSGFAAHRGMASTFSTSMRVLISTAFRTRPHPRTHSRTCWMSKPMTPIQKVGQRYFFRKRQPGQEQSCIYLRDGAEGTDQLLHRSCRAWHRALYRA